MKSTENASSNISDKQWPVLLAAFLGWLFDGFEIGLFPMVARPALKDMLKGAGDASVRRALAPKESMIRA